MTNAAQNARKRENRKRRQLDALPSMHHWSVVENAHGMLCLMGFVKNHPRFMDDNAISTSAVIAIDTSTATTESGSRYALGTPARAYLQYREDNRLGPLSDGRFRSEPDGPGQNKNVPQPYHAVPEEAAS